MTARADLEAQADAAARAGDLGQAARLLGEAAADGTDFQLLLKLGSVQRASAGPGPALATIERALALRPLDFMALVMRATLLDAAGSSEAAEAWTNALAQRPAELPAQLARIVAVGEAKAQAWQTEREERLGGATARFEQQADEDDRWRINRFRDNVLRKARVFHSTPTHYFYPGLIEREFHPSGSFPWLETLAAATSTITDEFRSLMQAERKALVPYVQYAAHAPLDQWKELNHNPDWTAIHLLRNGERIAQNADHCPQTMALLASLPQPKVPGASPNVMFSLLAPGTSIPPHVGVSNTRLICHLPLIVPDGCWFRVGAETREWRVGEPFVFDDTIEHEAKNPSDQLRVVLIFDVWHPGLSAVEQAAIAALTAADGGFPTDSH